MNETLNPQSGLVIGSGSRVADLGKSGSIGLLVGIVCTVILGILAFTTDMTVVTGSWMVGWYFWMTITAGMMGLSILSYTIRPAWSLPLLRLWQAGGGPMALLVMGILFLPVILNPGAVYPWANATLAAHDPIIQQKAPYLNVPFWTIRTVAYFGIWIVFTGFLRRSTLRQDENRDKNLEMGRSSWGAFGMVLFFLTYTFALIDWLMSLDVHWYSTMHGLWQLVASALGALGLSVAIVCVNATREPYTEVISPNLTKDWGNMLFANTMVWAYTAISQYLIMWNGNLPDSTQYYARRSFMWWNAIGMVTIVGQFFVPWMTLLSPRIKRYPYLLCQIAGWIFVVHMVDVYIAVAPALPTGTKQIGLETRAAGQFIYFDIIALLAVGGFWLYSFSIQVRKASLLVKYDHRLQEALTHAH
jgi:hypothetical protein